jgi:hypothetical protein
MSCFWNILLKKWLENDIFIGMAYFRSDVLDENNEWHWHYSIQATYDQFQEKFPEVVITFLVFKQNNFSINCDPAQCTKLSHATY